MEVQALEGPEPDRTFFEFRVLAEGLPQMAQVIELSLGIALQVFRFLVGADYSPLQVHLPHDPLTDPEDYRSYYGCTPCFAQRRAGFVLRTTDLSRALTHDRVAHEAMVRYLDSIVTTRAAGMSTPVRRLTRQLLPTGALSLELVADQFVLHPKTLQRRLAADGTTFHALVDQMRAEIAERYLRDTDINLCQLARELGYSEQSVLSRSCRRWFGCGPVAYREGLRATSAATAALPPGGSVIAQTYGPVP